MKVFLTGASGFLGEYVIKQLLKEKHTIRALALSSKELENIKGIEVVQGDITRPETLAGKLKGCKAVIHLAGAVGYGQTFENCIRVNVNGTRNLAAEAVSSGIKRFIHCSSVSVYGRVPDVNLYENAPYRKINDPYGDTKIEAEKVLMDMGKSLDLTIFRPTVIYGKGDMAFLHPLAVKIKAGNFKIIGSGECRITLIHAADVARAFTMVLKNAKTYGKIYNLSNTDNLEVKELAAIIAETVGYKKPLRSIPYRAAITVAWLMEVVFPLFNKKPPFNRFAVRILGRQYYYMTDAIQKDLDFKPSIKIRKGIVETLKAEGLA